jgi:cell pole-organizing protein PopZ
MSDQAAPEPTMEEILASIRRIISEDDSPAGLGAAAEDGGWRPPPAATDAGSTVIGDAELEDDILELTDPAPAGLHGDSETYSRAAPAVEAADEPPPAPAFAPAYSPAPAPSPAPVRPAAMVAEAKETLIAADAAQKSSSAFGRLAEAVTRSEPPPSSLGGRTLEDIAGELLRPMLKEWLDTHLPRIVQASVDEEVERIARGRVR